METDDSKDLPHVQVKLTSNSTRFSAPEPPFSVPVSLDQDALSQMLNQLLTESHHGWVVTEFDFLIEGELLRQTLQDHIKRQKLSTENVIYVECIMRTPPPAPDGSYHHDNWVGAVHCCNDCYLTGCYDNQVRMWSLSGGLLQSVGGHNGPIKAVKWVGGGERRFLSASQDQYVHIWKWDPDSDAVKLCCVCKGHARSVEGLSVNPDCTSFASVSWDKMLKVWSLTERGGGEEEEEDQEGSSKKRRLQGKTTTKTPLVTLSGHTQPVTGVVWPGADEVVTCGWDHCIRLWDMTACSNKSSLTGSKAFNNIDVDMSKRLVASASSDPYIRVWDPREKDGAVVKLTLAPHGGWVRAVQWSKTKQEQLVSASYDRLLKLWDTRSPRVPLYTMAAHEDKVLCLDWSLPAVVASGGADGMLRTHNMS